MALFTLIPTLILALLALEFSEISSSLGIIALLDQQGPLTVTEIHEALDIGQAVASHHLSIMKSKDILVSERDGKNSRYALRYECLNLVLVCMDRCRKDMKA